MAAQVLHTELCGHSGIADVLLLRDTGTAILCSYSASEARDMSAVSHAASIEVRLDGNNDKNNNNKNKIKNSHCGRDTNLLDLFFGGL